MSISAINTGLSGMKAYQSALDSSSHAVANASTLNFEPQQVRFQEAKTGGVTVNISQDGRLASKMDPTVTNNPAAMQQSGTDLEVEVVNALQYKNGFDFSARIIKTADAMLGTLIDIRS
jgi:flagellar hook-associated protein FlgK